MRGQAAVEYLMIFSTVLAILAAVTTGQMINPVQEAAGDALYLSQARSAADAIAGAINTVYANGKGAVKSISFRVDKTWGLQLDNSENRIRITIETSTGTQNVEDSLRYGVDNHHSLSNISPGTYTVIVEWSANDNMPENVDGNSLADDKIYIYIRAGGGQR
ncbi:MAG TPA: hypothetical protein EYP46_00755 [Hadesarchaea archaeon]|nr:hypothetical protein [Hadesarchaea archaeon]